MCSEQTCAENEENKGSKGSPIISSIGIVLEEIVYDPFFGGKNRYEEHYIKYGQYA